MKTALRVGGVAVLVAMLSGTTLLGSASAATTRLRAHLVGSNEVPGPGDPDAKGAASVRVDPRERTVCFTLRWSRMRPPFAAHIHRGRVGVAGPVKVELFAQARPLYPAIHKVSGCVHDVPRKLARRIAQRPARFYVNLHNKPFPDGAIRGQLLRP
jgi:hypothetical protein